MGLLVFSILIFISSNAQTKDTADGNTVSTYKMPDWYFAGESRSGTKYYVQSRMLEKLHNSDIKIWIKTLTPSFTFGKKDYKNCRIMSLMYFNCQNKTTQTISVAYYKSDGSTIATDSKEYEVNYVVPESVMESVLEKVCSLYN